MMSLRSAAFAIAAAGALVASPAMAQNYVSVSVGGAFLSDSDNSGQFDSDFTTGTGTTIPAGAVLPAGTDVGWSTEFDTGFALSAAVGRRFAGDFRGEIELAYQSNDVDTHSGVTVGGGNIDTEDAGVLITGSPALGTSVGALVGDGRGSVDTIYVMANGYYDFPIDAAIQPYIGAGIGVGFVDVDYSPSGVGIVSDDAAVFAYQVMAGASYPVSDGIEIFGQYRYRGTTDVETNIELFDGTLDVENGASIVEVGLRFEF